MANNLQVSGVAAFGVGRNGRVKNLSKSIAPKDRGKSWLVVDNQHLFSQIARCCLVQPRPNAKKDASNFS